MQKQRFPIAPLDEKGKEALFVISPNDLVYLPTEEERKNGIKSIDTGRIYRFVDSSDTTANFVPYSVAKTILTIDKEVAKKMFDMTKPVVDEFGGGSPQSKNQRAITKCGCGFGEMIKEICIPLKVDRLGNIISIGDQRLC